MTDLRLELSSTGGNNAGFVIPDDVVESLGSGRRPKVAATVNGYTWRTSIAAMGGRFLLGMNKEHRTAADVEAGQVLDLRITLDDAPRTVEVPDDLAAALAEHDLTVVWEAWSFTKKKEAARQLTEAKQPDTRVRRLTKIVADLGG